MVDFTAPKLAILQLHFVSWANIKKLITLGADFRC